MNCCEEPEEGIKYVGNFVDFMKRLEKIEQDLINTTLDYSNPNSPYRETFIVGLLQRIEKLEQERDKGIERLKKLEEFEDNYKNERIHFPKNLWQLDIEKRLEELEKGYVTHMALSDDRNGNIHNRIDQLETKLSQQNSVPNESQEISLLKTTDSNGKEVIFKVCGVVEEVSKKLAQSFTTELVNKIDAGICANKPVTVYEAIKALRDGKRIRREGWYSTVDWIREEDVLNAENLFYDDWIIED